MTFCFGHWLSAQATSDPTGQADMAKLRPNEKVDDKNQPGPIRRSTWAWPNNSAFLEYFFPINLVDYMGQAHIIAFLFLGNGLL